MPDTSNISGACRGGSIEGNALAKSVLPLPGAQVISTLCSPLAAIVSALFALCCHLICQKSTSRCWVAMRSCNFLLLVMVVGL